MCHSISNSLRRTFTTTWRWMEAPKVTKRGGGGGEPQSIGSSCWVKQTPKKETVICAATIQDLANLLFKKHLRDSGLPADVMLGKLKKDISFALRRGTIAQVTTHALDGYAWPARARPPRMRSSPSTWRVGIVKQSLRTMLISFLSLPIQGSTGCTVLTWPVPPGTRI